MKVCQLNRSVRWFVLILAVVSCWAFAERANACVQNIVPLECIVDDTGVDEITMCCNGYDTFGTTIIPDDKFCACGLGLPDNGYYGSCIQSIDSVDILNGTTKVSLGQFSFAANGTTTTSFTNAQSGPNWSGFWTQVSMDIPAGTLVDLCWTMIKEPSCSNVDVETELSDTFVGTDEADLTGATTGGHQSIVQPNSVIYATPTPVLGPAGVTAVGSLLAFSGIWWTLKRREDSNTTRE